MKHHTKDKGDKGVGFIIADLLKNNIQVCLPLSEHMPFDLIVMDENGKLVKLSVKYRALSKNSGSIEISRRSSWADKNGSHVRKHNIDDYDAFAIYCPDTNSCYYVNVKEFNGVNLTLRMKPTKFAISKIANNYVNPKRLFI